MLLIESHVVPVVLDRDRVMNQYLLKRDEKVRESSAANTEYKQASVRGKEKRTFVEILVGLL